MPLKNTSSNYNESDIYLDIKPLKYTTKKRDLGFNYTIRSKTSQGFDI